MSVFKSGKRGHKILAALENGPMVFSEINDLFPTATAQSVERSKLWRVVTALRDDGLVDKNGSAYVITVEGLEALTTMNYGHDYDGGAPPAQASVRVFGRERAA